LRAERLPAARRAQRAAEPAAAGRRPRELRSPLRSRHRAGARAHRGTARTFADAGDGTEPAHRLRTLRRDREEGASRGDDAARGGTRARVCRCGAVRRMGAPAGHDAPERLNTRSDANDGDGVRNADADADAASAGRGSLSILRALWPFMAPYRSRVAVAAAALLVAAAATLVVPLAFRRMIDVGFASPEGIADGALPADVNTWFLALFGVAVVLALGTALRYYSVSWLGERVTADLRRAVYRQVLRQDPRFFETLKTGEVLSRLSTDTTLIQTLVGTSISLGLRNALLFVGALVMLIVTSPQLASIIVGLLL